MNSYPVHPAADIFPLLEGEAFEAFRDDIASRGQDKPIDIWNGQLLDGRNRLRACNELGIEPKVRTLADDIDPVAHVVGCNLHRNHLTESQRALVGARAKALYEDEAKERQRQAAERTNAQRKGETLPANLPEASAGDRSERESRARAAAAVNVSPRSVEHATKVITQGTPELNRLVETGEVSVSAASAVASLPRPEQETVVAAGPDAVRRRAKEVRKKAPPMPPEDPQASTKARLGERWHGTLHDIYLAMNGVRDAGGIETLSARWDGPARSEVRTELERIASTLATWIEHLKATEASQ